MQASLLQPLPCKRKSGADSLRGGASQRDIRQQELDLHYLCDILDSDPDRADYLRGILSYRAPSARDHRIRSVTPPGSLLESITNDFYARTNIAIEMVIAMYMSYVAGALCRRGARIDKAGSEIHPNLCTVVLASSSSGKTYTSSRIGSVFHEDAPELTELSSAVSGAALLSSLHQKPTGLFLRDEWGQLIKNIEGNPCMVDYRDYLLRMYDCGEISRTTIREGTISVLPRVAILGLTVRETWKSIISQESMLDGLGQRFLYCLADPDPDRPWREYPEWTVDPSEWSGRRWDECVIHPTYSVSLDAQLTYENGFRTLFTGDLPESFARRVLWAIHKLALIYHIILGDNTDILTAIDYSWAIRYIAICLEDTQRVISEVTGSDLQRVIENCRLVADRCRSNGRDPTPRDLISGVRAIKSAHEARVLLSII